MGKRTLLTLAAIGILLFAAGAAEAALIAKEDFAGYDTNADLDGQDTNSTIGFDGTETWSTSGTSTAAGFTVESGSLNGPGLPEAGEKVKLWRSSSWNDTSGATAKLTPNSPLESTTYTALYFSALIDGDNLSDANSLIVAWDHETNKDRLHGFEIRGSGDIYSLGGGTSENADTGLDLASGVNLIVVRVTEKTGGNGKDEYDLWLNRTVEGDGPDYSAPESFNSGLVVENSDFGFDGFYLKEAYNGEQSALVDELLLGETFADVAVPEPATLALLGLGGLGLLVRRKR